MKWTAICLLSAFPRLFVPPLFRECAAFDREKMRKEEKKKKETKRKISERNVKNTLRTFLGWFLTKHPVNKTLISLKPDEIIVSYMSAFTVPGKENWLKSRGTADGGSCGCLIPSLLPIFKSTRRWPWNFLCLNSWNSEWLINVTNNVRG